ncbi:hypothetical protein JCM10908_002350 [Rhodotorula pacifica]|uniref:uncharacterized protein n=1 Tax=Rhodotorula pacifica TaxID=1495444 RepID=UPI00316DD685
MCASIVSPARSGLGLGGIALPHELQGTSDGMSLGHVDRNLSTPPKRPARPPLPHNSLSSPETLFPAPSPTSAAFPRHTTPLRTSRSGSVQHVTSDMISYPVMSARIEAVAGTDPISPTSKGWNPPYSSSGHAKASSSSEKKGGAGRMRPPPIKTGAAGSATSSGFFSPLRQKFGAFGAGKDKVVRDEESSPARQSQLEDASALAAKPSAPWRPVSDPSSSSPYAGASEDAPCFESTSASRLAKTHRRAASDSPELFSQARWRPAGRFDPIAPVVESHAGATATSTETLFLSASQGSAGSEQHFGQIPIAADTGAVVRLRSSRRPDELEVGWTCVPGVDALGIPYTTWEISLRPRDARRTVSMISTTETARPTRPTSTQSFQSYSMAPTPTPSMPLHDSAARHAHGHDSVSPTRSGARSRDPSSISDSSSYGSFSSDTSLWAGSSQQGKLSISSAATSAPDECYSPIDLTVYGVVPDATPPAIEQHRIGRFSSYAPGMAPFERPRQLSVNPDAANKGRSFSLSNLSSSSRTSTLEHVEGYSEELRMSDYGPRPSRRASAWHDKAPAGKFVPATTSLRTARAPSMSVAIDRAAPISTKPHLPSPLGLPQRQHDFDSLSIDFRTPTTQSTFSGPPLCPLPELPSSLDGKPSPESRFSIASSLDDLEADIQTACIQLVAQRPRAQVGSRWSDNEDI